LLAFLSRRVLVGRMPALSPRVTESLKTALAIVISYDIALRMALENPYWAAFAVAMVSLDTAGQSLNKASLRMMGTLLAVVVALTLVALCAQQRWASVQDLRRRPRSRPGLRLARAMKNPLLV
jgi:uncharacterized membrane protein YccC